MSTFPIGLDYIYDLKKSGIIGNNPIIIDAGANIGQSALSYSYMIKDSKIHSFEPVISTYNQLLQITKKLSHIECYHLALGSEAKEIEIALSEQSLNNSLVEDVHSKLKSVAKQNIVVKTLDQMVAELGIVQIDLLKIDTEGYDLEVLKGASNALGIGIVKSVYCEVGFNDEMDKIDLFHINKYLKGFNFRFVGLYETMRIGFNKLPTKYSNALFILK